MKRLIHLAKQSNAVRPLFDGARWDDGHKVVKCGNDAAVDFIKKCIDEWQIDENVKLLVVPVAELSKFVTPKAWLWAPCPYVPQEDLVTHRFTESSNVGC